VQGVDPLTGRHYDDTRRYVADSPSVGAPEKARIFSDNALGVYRKLRSHPRCSAR
jgi:4-oxalmesaconate hydratase